MKRCKTHDVDCDKNNQGKWSCPICRSNAVIRCKSRYKQRLVKYAGGKCIKCGYSKCIEALEFHHRDPLKKDFNLSSARVRKWEISLVEIAKCDLVCANCHREIHAEIKEKRDDEIRTRLGMRYNKD